MKLDELLKSLRGKELTDDDITSIMEEMTSVKLKAVSAKDAELKELSEKMSALENAAKENSKLSRMAKYEINAEEFKDLKAYDEYMALEEDKEEEFFKNLKEKKPSIFREKEIEEPSVKVEKNIFDTNRYVPAQENEDDFNKSKIISDAMRDVK